MSTVKLFNKGQRDIQGAGFVFKPQTALEFDAETAAKLKRLFPNELLSLDDVQKQFAPAIAPESVAAETPIADPVEDDAADVSAKKTLKLNPFSKD